MCNFQSSWARRLTGQTSIPYNRRLRVRGSPHPIDYDVGLSLPTAESNAFRIHSDLPGERRNSSLFNRTAGVLGRARRSARAAPANPRAKAILYRRWKPMRGPFASHEDRRTSFAEIRACQPSRHVRGTRGATRPTCVGQYSSPQQLNAYRRSVALIPWAFWIHRCLRDAENCPSSRGSSQEPKDGGGKKEARPHPGLLPQVLFFSPRPSSGLSATFSHSCGRRTPGEGIIVPASGQSERLTFALVHGFKARIFRGIPT